MAHHVMFHFVCRHFAGTFSRNFCGLRHKKLGPLSYLSGYIVCSLYKKSKNPYIASTSRGGLWPPHPWFVSIAKAGELTFKNSTNKEMSTHLPVETMVNQVLSLACVNGLWDNIVDNCDNEISKECKSLCQ